MTAVEHVVIPKLRFEKLMSRMTQRELPAEKENSASHSSTGEPNGPAVSKMKIRRITPTPVDSTEKSPPPFGSETDFEDAENEKGDNHEASTSRDIDVSFTKTSKSPRKRSLEEIEKEHLSFLPPGHNPTPPPEAKTKPRHRNRDHNVKKKKKSLATPGKTVRPYDSLKEKWITL